MMDINGFCILSIALLDTSMHVAPFHIHFTCTKSSDAFVSKQEIKNCYVKPASNSCALPLICI